MCEKPVVDVYLFSSEEARNSFDLSRSILVAHAKSAKELEAAISRPLEGEYQFFGYAYEEQSVYFDGAYRAFGVDIELWSQGVYDRELHYVVLSLKEQAMILD